VVVVGGGAAGAALSWRLRAAGVSVVCLERGYWAAPSDAPQDQPDWEGQRLRSRAPNPNVRRSAEDYPVLADTSPIQPQMFNGVGGSTVLWSAHTPRFRPSDFKVRSLDGVGNDWPIDYWDLAPYYELNDRISGVSGLAGDPGNPPRTPRTTPPVPLGPGGHRLADAFEQLGWHWWPTDGQVLTRDVGHRQACNGCGPCELACPRQARSSADITYWPLAVEAGVHLVTGATAVEVLFDAPDRASGVRWLDDDGVEHHTEAGTVVLAGNGIGTTRLLLTGGGSTYPDGIANSSGLVGVGLMLHPIAAATGVFAEPLTAWSGNSAFCLLSQEFYETDPARDFVRGYEMQVMRGQGPLITALGAFTLDIPWGPGHHSRFDELFGRVASVAISCEDLPDPANRIVIDDSARDRHGVPAARMIYRPDGNSRRMIRHGLAAARRALETAGAVQVLENPLLDQTGFHLMGTARMGSEPATSVVDADCRTHDIPNLMVIDGSVFASSAAANPTPTIQAVALRAADRLIATHTAVPA
jgi:choline dehydrogenase-like flavoprotein